MTANNFDVLRLMAAGLVLYGHSFALLGMREPLFLSWLPLGPLGVYIFFIISGYLVSQSWDRDPNLFRFFSRRSLRIFPGLTVCILLSIFVLGPVLTRLTLKDYFSHPLTWSYLENILLHTTYALPGVFENNHHPSAVNGSLWSLPVEFFMYVVVAIVGVVQGNRWVIAGLAFASAIGTSLWAEATSVPFVIYNFDFRYVFICGTYFWMGALFYKFDLKHHLSLSNLFCAAAIMLCLEPWSHQLRIASWVLLPIVALSFGLAHSPLLNQATRSGDYSYGLYIYAFPVQQTVAHYLPDIGIVAYIIVCSLVTMALAVVSWHWIERPALKLKPVRASASSTFDPSFPNGTEGLQRPHATGSSSISGV